MLQGITVSKWQGEMNWYKARDAGARFGFIRAGSITDTGGVCYPDDQFERNANLAPAYMPVGFFWYFRPYHDPVKQANYFCDLIRSKKQKLPPTMDLECAGVLLPYQVTAAAKKFAQQVWHRLDRWPLLYTRGEWFNVNTIADEFWWQLDLWIARYINLAGPWSDGKCKPRMYDDWRFWQKSADGNALGRTYGATSDSICIEYFNGDQPAFDLYVGGSQSSLVKILRPATALRSAPAGTIIGTSWRGRVWPRLGKSEDGNWIRVEGWVKAADCEEI